MARCGRGMASWHLLGNSSARPTRSMQSQALFAGTWQYRQGGMSFMAAIVRRMASERQVCWPIVEVHIVILHMCILSLPVTCP